MTKRYIVMGNPIPLMRARFAGHKVYDAQKHTKFCWGIELQKQHDNLPLYTGPLLLNVEFYFQLPKTSKARQEQLINKPHIYRPDTSNLLKFVEDVATGILFDDDCLISDIICKKRYSDVPRTEFTVIMIQ